MANRIFITRPVFDETVQLLKSQSEVFANSEDRILTRSELLRGLENADGAMTMVTDSIDREVLQRNPRLKVVANFGVGVNNIDLAAATEQGVVVTNTPGVLTETTADFAWALLMAAARRVAESDRFTRAGRFHAWGPKMFLGFDVFGRTLGLVGFGRIGQAVAARAQGFRMRVLYAATPSNKHDGVARDLGAEKVSMEDLFRRSDFISLHVPLLPETTHLLNDRTFRLMKPTCIVVNTSRGPVVEEGALIRALKNGHIAGAALDVYEHEPQIHPELLQLENVVLAPHIASASHDTRLKVCMMAADNLLSVLSGKRPPNPVNPAVWDRRRQ